MFKHKWIENVVLNQCGMEVLVQEDPLVCEICNKTCSEVGYDSECN